MGECAELGVNTEWKRIRRKRSCSILRKYPEIAMAELRKNIKIISVCSQYTDLDSNRVSPR
jgi:hypothetical protein